MNKPVASRQILLEAAKTIAENKGLQGINIRDVAKECGISVGAVYHYFPSKAELVVAVLEDFWKTVFHPAACGIDSALAAKGFPQFFEALYEKSRIRLEQFQSELLEQISLLPLEERRKGKEAEGYYWNHMKKGLRTALHMDPAISPEIWSGSFTEDAFVDFVFSNLITMLRENRKSCTFFTAALRRMLYLKEE